MCLQYCTINMCRSLGAPFLTISLFPATFLVVLISEWWSLTNCGFYRTTNTIAGLVHMDEDHMRNKDVHNFGQNLWDATRLSLHRLEGGISRGLDKGVAVCTNLINEVLPRKFEQAGHWSTQSYRWAELDLFPLFVLPAQTYHEQ